MSEPDGLYRRVPLADRLEVETLGATIYSDAVAKRGTLAVPDASPRFLQARPRLERRTESVARLHADDLSMLGFRSYIGQDGFFVDGQVNLPGATAAFAASAPAAGRYEDADLFFRNGDAFVAQEEPLTIDRDVISIASAEPSNYGSWLYRILPKLDQIDADDARPVLVYHNTAWQQELLDLFAPEREAIRHWPHRTYRLHHATILSPKNIGVYFDQTTLDLYRNAPIPLPTVAGHDRIYIKRGATRIRPIENEDQLIARLTGRGFFIVDPAGMTVAQQIAIYRQARTIVCPGGSGLFNLVFADRAEFVVDIEPSRDWLYAHCNVLQSCGIPHCVIFGDKLDPGIVHSPWLIDIAAVEQALDHAGA